MSEELLPCPCCGCEAHVIVEVKSMDAHSYWVECMNPNCWLCTRVCDANDVAVAVWNRRATPPAPAVPVDVDYTLRTALEIMRRRAVDVAAVDAALAWMNTL